VRFAVSVHFVTENSVTWKYTFAIDFPGEQLHDIIHIGVSDRARTKTFVFYKSDERGIYEDRVFPVFTRFW